MVRSPIWWAKYARRGNAKQCCIELDLMGFLGLVDLDMLLHAAHHRVL